MILFSNYHGMQQHVRIIGWWAICLEFPPANEEAPIGMVEIGHMSGKIGNGICTRLNKTDECTIISKLANNSKCE